MKTNFFKFSLPVLVFLTAIVFAYASEKSEKTQETHLVPGFIFQDNVCTEASRECENTGGPTCMQGSLVVHQFKSSDDTICLVPMTDWGG